jgi:PAS domain S-box-containing protein
MAQGDQTAIGTTTARYVLVLGMLATLAVVNHFLLEAKIRASHASAQMLHLTGRQRFLLHHTAALAKNLAANMNEAEQQQLRNDLTNSIRLMETSHRSLVEGNEAIGLPGAKTPQTRAIYFEGPDALDLTARKYFGDVRALIELPRAELKADHPAAVAIAEAAGDNKLLSAMDRAVEHYQMDQAAELANLRQLQRLALGSMLVLILLTALLIFRPMELRIRDDMAELKSINETLEERVAERSAQAERRAADAARSEAALEQQRRILKSILDSMADGVVVVDSQGKFILFNPAAEQILGLGPQDLPPQQWPEHFGLYLPDRETPYPAEQLPLVRAMQGEQVDRAEVFVRPGSGPAGIWLSTSARPLLDEAGQVRGGVAVFHNSTRRKQAEDALRHSEALYQSLIDALPLHFFRKDLDGAFTFANQRFCDVLKLSLDDLLGKTDFDFYPVELAEKYLRDDHRVADTGETFEDIEEHRKPTGEIIHVQVLKAPVRDAQGTVIGIQGIFWDVSMRMQAKAASA